MKYLLAISIALISVGCVTKSDLVPYMQFKDDVFRHCIRQCGGNVLDMKVSDNKLECVCDEKDKPKK